MAAGGGRGVKLKKELLLPMLFEYLCIIYWHLLEVLEHIPYT